MLGSLATVILPDNERTAQSPIDVDALEAALSGDHKIDAPVFTFSDDSRRLLRVSAQIYNTESEYAALAAALRELLPAKSQP